MKIEVGDTVTWYYDRDKYSSKVEAITEDGYCVYVTYKREGYTQDVLERWQIFDIAKSE